MVLQNSLNNENLDVAKKGVVIEQLTATLNFNSDDFNVVNGAANEVQVTMRDRAMTNGTARSLNSAFVVSATRDALVTYTFDFSSGVLATAPLITIQMRPNGVGGYVTMAKVSCGINGFFLSLGTITASIPAHFYIPRNYQVQLISSGGGTVTLANTHEVLL